MNHQVALGRFLDYGYVPMDDGIVERLHVRTALSGLDLAAQLDLPAVRHCTTLHSDRTETSPETRLEIFVCSRYAVFRNRISAKSFD